LIQSYHKLVQFCFYSSIFSSFSYVLMPQLSQVKFILCPKPIM